MLIRYLGGIQEVQDGGCSTCSGSIRATTVIKRRRSEEFPTLEGQYITFNQNEIKQVSDKTGLMLLDITYSYNGNTYNKFEVVS